MYDMTFIVNGAGDRVSEAHGDAVCHARREGK